MSWSWFATQTIDWFTQVARDHVHGRNCEERQQRALQVAGQAQLLLRRNFTELRGLAEANDEKNPHEALAPLIERYVRRVVATPRYRPWASESTRGVQLSASNSSGGEESGVEDALGFGQKIVGRPEETFSAPHTVDLTRQADADALAILRRYRPQMAKAAEIVLSGSSHNAVSHATGIARDSIPRILVQIQAIRDYGILTTSHSSQPFTRQTPGYQKVLQWIETEWGRLNIGADNTGEAAALANGELAGGKLYAWLLRQRCLELRGPDSIYPLLKRQPGCQSISRKQFKNKIEQAAKVFRDEYARQNAGQTPLDTTPGLRAVEEARRGTKGRRWSLDEPGARRAEKKNCPRVTISPDPTKAENTWRAMLIDDPRVSPADQAAFNIDFQDWLSTFTRRDRAIIIHLATGESVSTLAELFGTAPRRVTAMQRRYEQSWQSFQAAAPCAAAADSET